MILEFAWVGLTVHERQTGGDTWTVTTLMEGESLPLPEIGVELPIDELYEGVDLPDSELDSAATASAAPPWD